MDEQTWRSGDVIEETRILEVAVTGQLWGISEIDTVVIGYEWLAYEREKGWTAVSLAIKTDDPAVPGAVHEARRFSFPEEGHLLPPGLAALVGQHRPRG
jgi:hypothetical protein